jgi:hypothetical protein
LVKIAGRTSDPVRALDPEFSAARPWFIAPVLRGAVPHGARADIPSSYAGEDLRAIIPNAEKLLLVYGGRYLVIVNGATPERALDLEAFRHPPKATPRWQQFAHQDVTFAQERDGVLYVCNGGGSYAREVYGKKGFLSAIDSATGKLLWRSAPLTCNATFAMLPEYLITGYGFTAEPDYVFLVRRSDGAIVQRLRLPTGPDTIELVGDRVRVETYDHTLDFELR